MKYLAIICDHDGFPYGETEIETACPTENLNGGEIVSVSRWNPDDGKSEESFYRVAVIYKPEVCGNKVVLLDYKYPPHKKTQQVSEFREIE